VSCGNPIVSDVIYGSYGAYVLDNLPDFGEYGETLKKPSSIPIWDAGRSCWIKM
jgi:hypothetical protein